MLAIMDVMIGTVDQPPNGGDPCGSRLEGSACIEPSCLNQSSNVVDPNSKHTCDDSLLAVQTSAEKFDDFSSDIPRLIRDFNYPNKTVGYLSQESTDFEFIGPDCHPVAITTLPQLMDIADIIRGTGFPNYKVARIPILSGLNVKAWESYLQDYSDKRVVQYIRFGFPLSLIEAGELGNKEVTNHYSACQYPEEVQKYIDKEKSLVALLGPVNNISHEQYHCSPLMTRPKDNGSRRVILDLSYPRGHSVNSHVDKGEFDQSAFILKFPNIDHIMEDIVNCTEEWALFKIDVARAFHNLRVDPCDSLKLGIYWKGQYYADLAVAFGWTHRSGAFQLLSDAVAFIVAKAAIKLHCYIDDYIAVVPKAQA